MQTCALIFTFCGLSRCRRKNGGRTTRLLLRCYSPFIINLHRALIGWISYEDCMVGRLIALGKYGVRWVKMVSWFLFRISLVRLFWLSLFRSLTEPAFWVSNNKIDWSFNPSLLPRISRWFPTSWSLFLHKATSIALPPSRTSRWRQSWHNPSYERIRVTRSLRWDVVGLAGRPLPAGALSCSLAFVGFAVRKPKQSCPSPRRVSLSLPESSSVCQIWPGIIEVNALFFVEPELSPRTKVSAFGLGFCSGSEN